MDPRTPVIIRRLVRHLGSPVVWTMHTSVGTLHGVKARVVLRWKSFRNTVEARLGVVGLPHYNREWAAMVGAAVRDAETTREGPAIEEPPPVELAPPAPWVIALRPNSLDVHLYYIERVMQTPFGRVYKAALCNADGTRAGRRLRQLLPRDVFKGWRRQPEEDEVARRVAWHREVLQHPQDPRYRRGWRSATERRAEPSAPPSGEPARS